MTWVILVAALLAPVPVAADTRVGATPESTAEAGSVTLPAADPGLQPESPTPGADAVTADGSAPAAPPRNAPMVLPRATPAVTGSDWLQMLAGLALVMTLIIGCAWLARRMSGAGAFGNRHLKVLSSLSLGARERIALIEVGSEQVLVGVTPNSIRRLHVLENPVASDVPGRPTEFSRRIQELIKRGETHEN